MTAIPSQIASLTIATLTFIKENIKAPVNSPQKGSVTRNMFPFGDVIMISHVLFPLKYFSDTTSDCIYHINWQFTS